MRANPELYAQLKDKTTKLGVNLGHCIKTGIDNKGTIFEGFWKTVFHFFVEKINILLNGFR